MEYYQSNMEILKRKYKYLYDLIEEYHNRVSVEILNNNIIARIRDEDNNIDIYIEPARKGHYTLRVKTENNDIYFHSKYDPVREAEKIARDFGFNPKKQIIVLGSGLGYYLNQFDKRSKYDRIIIIEPFLSVFYAAICFNNLADFLENDNLFFIIGRNDNIFEIIQSRISLSLDKELDFLEHTPSIKLFNDEYREIYREIKESINFQAVGIYSDIKTARRWRDNIIRNLPYIFTGPKADDFFALFAGIPAICVSAGPSLDKNIEEIKKAKDKALILCVGTALKVLKKHDIEPDIVVSMDGNPANYRHFEGINGLSGTFLLTELGNYFKINRDWAGGQIFFTMKRNFSGWVERIKGNYTSIYTGGTVAHSMVDLAYRFGADPIVLVGQDLSFAEGRTHASGAACEGEIDKNREYIEVEDVNGRTVLTDKVFLSMLTFFNNYFARRRDRRFIDASEGGARIKHTEIMKLKDVINNYCNKKVKARDILRERYVQKKPDFDTSLKILEKEIANTIKELEKGINITGEQLETIEQAEKEIKNNKNLSVEELLKLEKRVSSHENILKGIKSLDYFVERILLAEAMKLNESKSKYYLDQRKSLEERMKYYKTYRIKFLSELEKCLSLLEKIYLNENNEIEIDRKRVNHYAGEEQR